MRRPLSLGKMEQMRDFGTSLGICPFYLFVWGICYSIHNQGAHRAYRGAVAAGQAQALVHLSKTVLVVKNSAVGAGSLAGAAAFAVLLIDPDTFL